MKITRLLFFPVLTILIIYVSTTSGCSREYSCKGCIVKDTLPPIDTLPSDTTLFIDTAKIDSNLNIPRCNTCDSTKPLAINSWGFKVNNSFICGVVDSSLFDTEKYSFDFWGHMQCSNDTGFRIVAFFYPSKFTADRFNVSTTNQSFILQDRINYMNPWSGCILRTDGHTPLHTIKVVVDTFNNSTKLMVGRFYGYAYTKNLDRAYVDGKFRFIVH